MKWHKGSHKKHLSYRAHIKSDGKVKISNLSATALKVGPTKEPILGGFDGADGLWKSFDEHLDSISNATLRQRYTDILEVGRSLEKEKVLCFSRRNGFSFIIRGLKVAHVRVNPAGFSLILIKNIHNTGRRSVRHETSEYVFSSINPNPLSDFEIRTHLLEQSQTLLALRHPNTIGYMEKWLHCLLVEEMISGGLPELGLDFLHYETPVGKVKRNKQFGREHVDILARDRNSGALVVVEVKKDDSDLNAAIVQGISYVGWIRKHKSLLAPRVKKLGWDVDLDNVKLYVVAPGGRTPPMNSNARLVLVNQDWYVDEKVEIIS